MTDRKIKLSPGLIVFLLVGAFFVIRLAMVKEEPEQKRPIRQKQAEAHQAMREKYKANPVRIDYGMSPLEAVKIQKPKYWIVGPFDATRKQGDSCSGVWVFQGREYRVSFLPASDGVLRISSIRELNAESSRQAQRDSVISKAMSEAAAETEFQLRLDALRNDKPTKEELKASNRDWVADQNRKYQQEKYKKEFDEKTKDLPPVAKWVANLFGPE